MINYVTGGTSNPTPALMNRVIGRRMPVKRLLGPDICPKNQPLGANQPSIGCVNQLINLGKIKQPPAIAARGLLYRSTANRGYAGARSTTGLSLIHILRVVTTA